MDIPILLSFIKELSAVVDIEKIHRFLNAFLSNFFKGYVNFDVFLGEKEYEIKPLFGKYKGDYKKLRDFLITFKSYFFEPVEKISVYTPLSPDSRFLFYYPFFHFRKFFGFLIIEFKEKQEEDRISDLEFLSSFLGSIFLSSYLYERRKESEKRLEINYDLALFSTRTHDPGKVVEYLIKNIYEKLSNIESVCFYEVKGNCVIPKFKRGKDELSIVPIESSFPGEALKKMSTITKGRELATLIPTKDFIHGILYIKKKKGFFDEEEVKTFEMISNTLSIAIENANFVKEIRERKASLEEEVRKLIEKRAQEEKMALVGKVTASIIHELKNLIAGVLSVSEIIELREQDERIKELVRAMKEEGEMMQYLLISLLEIAKPFTLDIKENSLKEIVEKTISLSKFFIKGKKINFSIIFPFEVKILCDKVKFELALLNLFKNSIEAIEKEGDIVVALKKNKDYLLEVKDTGSGIEKEYIDKIFEPFFSRKKKGAGLGLSFVKKVIEGHGFKISVWSIIGEGTKFIIEIPEKFIKGSIPSEK